MSHEHVQLCISPHDHYTNTHLCTLKGFEECPNFIQVQRIRHGAIPWSRRAHGRHRCLDRQSTTVVPVVVEVTPVGVGHF
jgi:hypothetical protein